MILDPKRDKYFEVFVYAVFLGLWDKESVTEHVSMVNSRTGYILTFAEYLALWTSTL